jgi:hypothetical protein
MPVFLFAFIPASLPGRPAPQHNDRARQNEKNEQESGRQRASRHIQSPHKIKQGD